MNAILLAAGYGTRLYPLTRDTAKPLLPVGGRPIIDRLVESLEAAPQIQKLVLVTNARFADDFRAWAEDRSFGKPLQILNDSSTCNADRLGAVADVRFVLEEAGAEGRPAYVLATDNLPRFDLMDIIGVHEREGVNAVFACPEESPRRLRRSGVAELDEDGRVVSFEEKPDEPKGRYRVPPFYVYTGEAMAAVGRYLEAGGNPDAPGHFLAWVVEHFEVHALRRPQGTHDIGTLESYRAVCAEFAEGEP
jgi:glucose-1-phosphate thymidylyltransferase